MASSRYLDQRPPVNTPADLAQCAGMLALYFPAQSLLPAKTRVFVDFVVDHFREEKLALRFSALA
ncbi:MAG TPA: hypothetical protein VF450_26665 [Noviherbaspirillum sp.]